MKQLSYSARRLFELARGQDEPDALARNRVARVLSARIATEAGLMGAVASVSASAAPWGSIAAKSTMVVGVTSALVAAGWLTMRTLRPAAPPVVSPQQAPLFATSPPPDHAEEKPSSQPHPLNATKVSGSAPAHRKHAQSSIQAESPTVPIALEAEDGLRAETDGLRLAQQALRDGMPQEALRLLDQQDLRFRDGLLHPERAAARILALCQAGQVGEARAQAVRFEQRWPRSALLGRVRAACWTP
jgi:hypothetical protein